MRRDDDGPGVGFCWSEAGAGRSCPSTGRPRPAWRAALDVRNAGNGGKAESSGPVRFPDSGISDQRKQRSQAAAVRSATPPRSPPPRTGHSPHTGPPPAPRGPASLLSWNPQMAFQSGIPQSCGSLPEHPRDSSFQAATSKAGNSNRPPARPRPGKAGRPVPPGPRRGVDQNSLQRDGD